MAVVRASTAAYHNVGIAQARGYSILADTAGKTCIDQPGVGGMGVHYVNGDLVGDPAINAMATRSGGLRARTATASCTGGGRVRRHQGRLGREPQRAARPVRARVHGHRRPNRYGLPAFYSLHVWAWDHNPTGTFEMWNPEVVCP